MKKGLYKGLAMAGATILAACGAPSDSFAPGEWELEAWMEVDGRSGQIEPRTDSVTIPQNMAGLDPRGVAFSKFYHGQVPTNVEFSDGVISGHLNQSAIAPFEAHEQAITGTYTSDAFEMRITMPTIGGYQSYQVISGKLVEPL